MSLFKNIFKKKEEPGTGPNYNGLVKFSRPIDERIAILEMLLWKVHIENIPSDVFDRLVKNGFLEKSHSGGWTWTSVTAELERKFNEEFNYDN